MKITTLCFWAFSLMAFWTAPTYSSTDSMAKQANPAEVKGCKSVGDFFSEVSKVGKRDLYEELSIEATQRGASHYVITEETSELLKKGAYATAFKCGSKKR